MKCKILEQNLHTILQVKIDKYFHYEKKNLLLNIILKWRNIFFLNKNHNAQKLIKNFISYLLNIKVKYMFSSFCMDLSLGIHITHAQNLTGSFPHGVSLLNLWIYTQRQDLKC